MGYQTKGGQTDVQARGDDEGQTREHGVGVLARLILGRDNLLNVWVGQKVLWWWERRAGRHFVS